MDDLIPPHIRYLRGIGRAAATVEARERLLKHMDRHLPEGVERASEDDIVGYMAQYAKPWTHYTYDSHARGAYSWWFDRDMIDFNPMARIPKPTPGPLIPHPCSDEDLALALSAPWPHGRAMALASRLGLRCGEIARANRRDVVGRRLRVVGKGGRVRMVPIAEETWDELIGPVTSGPLLGDTTDAHRLSHDQRRVWRRLRLPESVTLHSGRHWFATRLLENGVDIRVVQVLLGHASIRTTEGYTQVTDARVAAAVERLPRIEASEPAAIRLGRAKAA